MPPQPKMITVEKQLYENVLINNANLLIEVEKLKAKLDRAIKGIGGACAWLTCMEDLSRLNDGKCNEQMALEMLNKTIEKLK